MASSIILKKSSVAARVPVVGDLAYGELALNYADGALYYKRSDNTIQNLLAGAGSSGVSSFNTRTGAITLTSSDVTDALTYTPFSSAGGTLTGALTVNGGITVLGEGSATFTDSGISTGYGVFSGGINVTGQSTLNGNVGINIASGSIPLDVNHVGGLTYGFRVGDNATVANSTGIYMRTTSTATLAWGAGGKLVFATSGGSVTRFSIGSVGQLGVGPSESFGTVGQVLTSGGPSAAPTWSTPSGGGITTGKAIAMAMVFGG